MVGEVINRNLNPRRQIKIILHVERGGRGGKGNKSSRSM